MMDDGDPEVPPQFACESCGGEMYPEYYKGVHGYEYRVEDRIGKIEVGVKQGVNPWGNGYGVESLRAAFEVVSSPLNRFK
jgi:hypothetical protein